MYEVTTFEVCAVGYERLRTPEEFILVTPVDSKTTPEEILSGWKDDIQICFRPEDFNYDEANRVVEEYVRDVVAPKFSIPNPFGLEEIDEEDDSEIDLVEGGVYAYLYVRLSR